MQQITYVTEINLLQPTFLFSEIILSLFSIYF